jgi:HK97 family phage major capsid protein
VTKIITDSFEAAYGAMEGPNTGHRAQNAAARLRVTREEPVYRFDGEQRGASMVRDFWRANTERDQDAVERLRKFQAQQRDMVDLLVKTPPSVRAGFAGAATTNVDTDSVIPPGYRPDLFVNELMQSRPIVAQASRGTITDATPFVVPRFVSSTGLTADHTEGTNPSNGTIVLDSITVSPGAVSGMFELTREIVDAANPAIDAIALAAMRESYNQQTEVKAHAALNGAALAANTEDITTAVLGGTDGEAIGLLRGLLADYPFHRFAAPTGAVMSQAMTRHLATAVDPDGRPLLPSVGASNTSGVGNAVSQGWFVDGLPFVPAWAMTETEDDHVAIVTNRADWWAWESPLLTFRFEEKSGPAKIELALFAYFATAVLRPAGFSALVLNDTP